MKLLNREPTEEMLRAADDALNGMKNGYTNSAGYVWKAMYDAAPEINVDMYPVAWQVIAKNGRTTGPIVRDTDELKEQL